VFTNGRSWPDSEKDHDYGEGVLERERAGERGSWGGTTNPYSRPC